MWIKFILFIKLSWSWSAWVLAEMCIPTPICPLPLTPILTYTKSQGSCDHKWPWTGTRTLSLEIAPTTHAHVQRNWASGCLFPLTECYKDLPSGEQRCCGRLRRWRLGALGGWGRLSAWEASLGGAGALWRSVSSLPLPGSAEKEGCQRTTTTTTKNLVNLVKN